MSYASLADRGAELEFITPKIVRVPLPLPLPDLKVINTYIILADDGLTIIDPGWASNTSESVLLDAIDMLGGSLADVRRMLVTHQHWDHYSQGVRWRDTHGVELMLGAEERHSITSFATTSGVHPLQVGLLVEAGAAALATEIAALEWEPYELRIAFTAPDRWLRDGETIGCGSSSITVRATPGHTRGHVVFEDDEHGVVFTGDHLLPRITPSLAFERMPEQLPLRSYLGSLNLLLDLPDARMLPAHGRTDGRTHVRAAELVDHHRQRLNHVADLVAAGCSTSFEVGSRMLWTRHDRQLRELNIVHRMTAVLEVKAHLDLLVAQGALTSAVTDGVHVFSPA